MDCAGVYIVRVQELYSEATRLEWCLQGNKAVGEERLSSIGGRAFNDKLNADPEYKAAFLKRRGAAIKLAWARRKGLV